MMNERDGRCVATTRVFIGRCLATVVFVVMSQYFRHYSTCRPLDEVQGKIFWLYRAYGLGKECVLYPQQWISVRVCSPVIHTDQELQISIKVYVFHWCTLVYYGSSHWKIIATGHSGLVVVVDDAWMDDGHDSCIDGWIDLWMHMIGIM
jgi:hypothetical protein